MNCELWINRGLWIMNYSSNHNYEFWIMNYELTKDYELPTNIYLYNPATKKCKV